MFALAIMAGVVLTVITTFNHHLSLATRDREETIAVLLARAKLEDPEFKTFAKKSGDFSPDWPGITWYVDSTPLEIIPGVDRLTLTVSWDDKRKKLDLVQFRAK